MRSLLLSAAVLCAAAPATAQNISGTYSIEGRNPDGSAYAGALDIQCLGGGCTGTWNIAGQTSRGEGPQEGRVLTLNIAGSYPAVYVVMPDGTLHGTWADGRGLERASPMR